MKRAWQLTLVLFLAGGCATTTPEPLTPHSLVAMTQAGLSDAEIIDRLAATRTVLQLNATEVVRLRQAGVSEQVLTAIRATYIRFTTVEQRRADVEEEEWQQRFGSWYRRPPTR